MCLCVCDCLPGIRKPTDSQSASSNQGPLNPPPTHTQPQASTHLLHFTIFFSLFHFFLSFLYRNLHMRSTPFSFLSIVSKVHSRHFNLLCSAFLVRFPLGQGSSRCCLLFLPSYGEIILSFSRSNDNSILASALFLHLVSGS